jgi:hypothetical protein
LESRIKDLEAGEPSTFRNILTLGDG